MIVHGRQRNRYGMIWYNRDLIGDAEVELHTVVDLKTAKHNARAPQPSPHLLAERAG